LQESYRKLRKSSTFAIRQAAARLSPSGSKTFQTTFSPVLFGTSFMKIRSAVAENGCLIFLTDKKQKNKKTSAKHIRIRLLPEGGCINNSVPNSDPCLFRVSYIFASLPVKAILSITKTTKARFRML